MRNVNNQGQVGIGTGGAASAKDVPINAAQKYKVLESYGLLTPSQISKKHIPELPEGVSFTAVPLRNGAVGSVSFGHPDFAMVPSGALVEGAHRDPNQATSFYLQIGRSTNWRLQNPQPGFYGPFNIDAAFPR